MAFVTGDVVAVTGEELPFKVVFMQGETVLAEWLVEAATPLFRDVSKALLRG